MRPSRIQFSCKTKCQFNCEFCVYDGTTDYFHIDDFKKYAKMFHDFGVRQFELTPVTGEALLDHQLTWKIEYLHELGAEKILFFSNGYSNLYEYDKGLLQQYPEIEINLSIYGGSKDEYIRRTGVDGYEQVLDNIYKFLGDKDLDPKRIIFHKRYSGSDFGKLKVAYDIARMRGITIWDCSHDTDWKKMTEYNCDLGSSEKGVCRFALEDNAVLPNGDVTLCGWFDVNKTMLIGNVNEQTLSEIYSEDSKFSKTIKEQEKGVYRGLCCTCTMRNDQRN